MFIFWGTKVKEKHIGYGADFCPMCRDIRQFRISRRGRSGHVYGFSIGSGELIGHSRTCMNCKIVLGAYPNNYLDLERRPSKASIETLVESTFPDIRTYYNSRIQLESLIDKQLDELDPELRKKMLLEPFELLSPKVEARFQQAHIDFIMLGIIILSFFLASAAAGISSSIQALAGWELVVFFMILCLGFVAVFFQSVRAKRKFMQTDVYAPLAATLASLKPAEHEIQWAIDMMTRSTARIGKFSKAGEIMNLLTKKETNHPTKLINEPLC